MECLASIPRHGSTYRALAVKRFSRGTGRAPLELGLIQAGRIAK